MNTNKRSYVVTAASGRIGGRVAAGLLRAGHEVRVIGRNAARLQPLAQQGAVLFVGNLADRGILERAFAGADAALLLVPGNRASRNFRRYFTDLGATYAAAARTARLRSALFVSSLGAHTERHRGLVLVHRDVELELNEVATLAVTHLRASFFYENLFYFLPAMQARGGLYTPIDPEVQIDMAPTSDVAALALRLLAELPPRTTTHELRGVRPLSLREIADVIGRQLGRTFPCARTPRAENVDAMVAAGSSYDFAHQMNDAWDTFSAFGTLRDPEATASSNATTPIEDFVRAELAPKLSQ
jgi:uncharacterized protein YbjT (DUF2867 family)